MQQIHPAVQLHCDWGFPQDTNTAATPIHQTQITSRPCLNKMCVTQYGPERNTNHSHSKPRSPLGCKLVLQLSQRVAVAEAVAGLLTEEAYQRGAKGSAVACVHGTKLHRNVDAGAEELGVGPDRGGIRPLPPCEASPTCAASSMA